MTELIKNNDVQKHATWEKEKRKLILIWFCLLSLPKFELRIGK